MMSGRQRSSSGSGSSSNVQSRHQPIGNSDRSNSKQLQFADNDNESNGSDGGGAYYSLLSDIGGSVPLRPTNHSAASGVGGDRKSAIGSPLAIGGGMGIMGRGSTSSSSSLSQSSNDDISRHPMHWLTLQFVDS
jgi:hypothetical protein